MRVDKLLEANNLKLPFDLNNCIDHNGADGAAYSIDSNRVLKVSVLYDWKDNLVSDFKRINETLLYLKNNPQAAFAQVFEFKYLGIYNRTIVDEKKQNYILYYYTLEKLNKISEDEKKVFHTILSHEDANIEKKYIGDSLNKVLEGLSWGLDFSQKEVKLFCENIRKANVEHNDINPRNIMKTKAGSFRLIDFDRCSLKKGIL